MVTLNEQIDIKAPYEQMEAWVDHFQEEFVRWSPYHTECEMYDGGYQKGMRVRFREIVGGMDYNVTGTITECEQDKDHFRIVFQSDKKTAFITFEGNRTEDGCHFSHTEAFGLTRLFNGIGFAFYPTVYDAILLRLNGTAMKCVSP